MSERQPDETGLCAPSCECARCEAGFRPTELERAAARRSLALAKAARERIANANKPKPAGTYPAGVPWYARHVPSPRPYTDDEKAELAKLREDFKKRGNHG